MMTLYGHASIVPYDIDTIFFNSSRGKIPIAWKTDIGFIHLLTIDIKSSIPKFNLFILQGDHALQKHDLTPSKTDHDHIMPFRL
jgi:hypothetical protein